MTFGALTFLAEVLLILLPGLILHRPLAMRVLMLDAGKSSYQIDEVELLGFGLLPALAIANTVGTVLAVVHGFYWWSYLAVMAGLVAWRWRDARATWSALGALVARSFRSLAHGNLMVLVVIAIFLQTGAGMLVEAQVPSANIDVWNHNFPLAESIVAHHGFVMPQINNMFYGTYPIFFHMFFAEGLLFVKSVMAAKAANALLYICFLLSLIAFARRWHAVVALVIAFLLIYPPLFTSGVADVMTDVSRVCFTTAAFVFAYQYFRVGRVYFLLAAGLLAGGAMAGKYTEILTPLLIGASLLPALIVRKPGAWTAVLVFAGAAVVTGAYPYLRNLILLHNPIYPFVFAHPGLADAYVSSLQAEVFHAYPDFRDYSHNLLSFQGWHDLFKAVYLVFFTRWNPLQYIVAVTVVGVVGLHTRALLIFGLWTFAYWIFWDLLGYMNPRWGMSPLMMLLVMPLLVGIELMDRVASMVPAPANLWHPRTWSGAGEASRQATSARSALSVALQVGVAIWALVICKHAVALVRENDITYAFPSWLSRNLASVALQPGGLEAYLLKAQEGHEIYRYIGDHDLRMVLQPFDNGAGFYQVAYNDGKNGDWMYPWHQLPRDPSQYDAFLRDNKIRYFVYRPSLPPFNAERLGEGSGNPKHAEMAYALMRYLMPGSRLLLTDSFGWELREIAPDKLK